MLINCHVKCKVNNYLCIYYLDPDSTNTNQVSLHESQNSSKKSTNSSVDEELVSDMDLPSTSYYTQQRELRKSCLKKSVNKQLSSRQIPGMMSTVHGNNNIVSIPVTIPRYLFYVTTG